MHKELTESEKEILKNKPELATGSESNFVDSIKLMEEIDNLDRDMKNLSDQFISIGFRLKSIKESNAFDILGFKDIYEFADVKYHLGKTSVKNFIAVYEKFGSCNHFPGLKSEFKDYSFSQLVELLPEPEDKLNNFSPMQTIKEMRLVKFAEKVEGDKKQIECWIKGDLLKFLKQTYPEYKVSFGNGYYDFALILSPHSLIKFEQYTAKGSVVAIRLDTRYKYDYEYTLCSLKLIKRQVDRFIKMAKEEEKEKVVGQTSDRETVEVEVVDAVPARPQKLKNDKMREEFIKNPENWNLLYDLTEVNARIFRHKEVPEFFEIQYFGKQYGIDPEMAWHHAEWHLVKDDETFGRSMFHCSSSSISGLVAFLKEIKF